MDGLQPIFQRVIGLDIHQAQATACAIVAGPDGQIRVERRQFGVFKKDCRDLAEWCLSFQPDEVVMEVVNVRHAKQVHGRKTDVGDAEWLAMLAHAGLLGGSFVPPAGRAI